MKIFFYIVAFISSLGYSQDNILVTYTSLILDDADEFGCVLYDTGTLVSNNVESLYYESARDTIVETANFDTYSTENSDYKFTYYKNLKEKYIIQDRNYGLKKVILDKNYNILWEIRPTFKFILGYQCQLAVGNFRGREYAAYFLKDIPISNGPFKFDGLPGLILEVTSSDGAVKILATSIEYGEEKIRNPFKIADTATWEDFKKFYKLRFDRVMNHTLDEGFSVSIPNRYIEQFID